MASTEWADYVRDHIHHDETRVVAGHSAHGRTVTQMLAASKQHATRVLKRSAQQGADVIAEMAYESTVTQVEEILRGPDIDGFDVSVEIPAWLDSGQRLGSEIWDDEFTPGEQPQALWPVYYREFTGDPETHTNDQWVEPDSCHCPRPHSNDLTCQRCALEFFAKSRKTWNEETLKFDYDPYGDLGSFFQSTEINNLRAHAVNLPTENEDCDIWLHGMGLRHIIVMTEFLGLEAIKFTRRIPIGNNRYRLKEESYTKRILNVIGWMHAHDMDDAVERCQALAEEWRMEAEYLRAGFDNVPADLETLRPMGAAVVSPELLESMAERRGSEVIA